MRVLRYTALPGVDPGEATRTGTLANLAREIPYLLVWEVLPPVRVLNEVLRTGEHDAGMSGGCRWEPPEVSPVEHEELAAALAMPVAEPLGWARSYADWTVWMMKARHSFRRAPAVESGVRGGWGGCRSSLIGT